MKSEKLSFKNDLWGQYNKLHERLKKKKAYLKNLNKSLEPIYDVFKELGKKLDSFKISSDPTISQNLSETSDSEEIKLYGIPLTINNYIKFCQNLIDYNNQTFFHITNGIDDLLKKIESEKEEFNNFIKCLKSLSENKNIMEKNMRLYHQKMSAAEYGVKALKDAEIRLLTVNNDPSNIANKNILEEKANQLVNDSVKPFKIYFDNVQKVNEIRIESIEMQKTLLYKYQHIEEEEGKTNTSFAKIILLTYENINKELIEKNMDEIQTIIKNININRDIKQLIIDNKGDEKPEEEILFIHFPSILKFDESDDNKTFEIYKKSIEFIKGIIEEEYPNYDEKLEKDKNDMREILYKLFSKYEQDKTIKIKEYIKNVKVHSYFLILLSKLRTNNRYEQSKAMIDFLGSILNTILDEAEKTKNYQNAKNCIILSQTFYCDYNGNKYYILEKIKNHKWLSNPDYWINYIDIMLEPEFDKLIERYPQLTKEDIRNNTEKITNNLKKKLSDIIYSQILPFVNNMKEFGISLKKIVEIAEGILNKYDFLCEEDKINVFSLISEDQEEINKLRENYEKKKEKNNDLKKEEINNNVKETKNLEKENTIQNNDNKKLEKINNNKDKKENKNNNNKKIEDKNKIDNQKVPNVQNVKKIEEKNNDTKKKKNNEIQKESIQNNNINNIPKTKEKENEEEKFSALMRSATISLSHVKKKEIIDDKKKENSALGIFKNIKNKFLNKDANNNENEKKKEDHKDVKKEVNIEQHNKTNKEFGNKMVKINFESVKFPLKPIPKNDGGKITINEKNIKQTTSPPNPFGVVLKKIDKGKNGK